MSAAQQYADLVTKLHSRTKAGELTWEVSSWESTPSTQLAQHKVKIFMDRGSEGQDLVQVEVSKANQVIDQFTDEDLPSTTPPGVEYATYFGMMQALYVMARRAANGADKAIASIIDELDSDEPPF